MLRLTPVAGDDESVTLRLRRAECWAMGRWTQKRIRKEVSCLLERREKVPGKAPVRGRIVPSALLVVTMALGVDSFVANKL